MADVPAPALHFRSHPQHAHDTECRVDLSAAQLSDKANHDLARALDRGKAAATEIRCLASHPTRSCTYWVLCWRPRRNARRPAMSLRMMCSQPSHEGFVGAFGKVRCSVECEAVDAAGEGLLISCLACLGLGDTCRDTWKFEARGMCWTGLSLYAGVEAFSDQLLGNLPQVAVSIKHSHDNLISMALLECCALVCD